MSTFCIYGTGNIAWNLSHALDKCGHKIDSIIGRDILKAKELASKFGAFYTDSFQIEMGTNDFIILCVSDDGYEEIVDYIPNKIDSIVLHTSGTTDIQLLNQKFKNCGVLYPLQSFKKDKLLNFLHIPVLYEGNNTFALNLIKDLASDLSNIAEGCNSINRRNYHLAAVWVNNFTNHLYGIGYDYLHQYQLSFNHLLPIIHETANRLERNTHPDTYQTGPAKRNDSKIIEEHIQLLEADDLKSLYAILTKRIQGKK